MSWFDDNAPETPQRGPGTGSTTVDYTGATGAPPAGGFTWPNTPPPVVHQGDIAADVPGLPHGSVAGGTTAGGGTTTTDPAGEFAQYLSRHPGNPQAAIDEWNAAGDHGGLKPAWEPGSKTIGLANGTYLVMPGTGGNSGAGWQTVQRSEKDGGNGAFSFPSWNETFSYAPWDKTFTAPDGLTEQNDPGFKAREQLGADAIQRSALAQGTGLTGGTLKDLEQFGQTFASTEYGNVYGRALTDYNTALDAYKTNYNTAAQQYNQRYGQYGDAYNRAYQTYMGNFGVSNTLNQEGFANSLSLAQLGLAGAQGTNNAGSQYAAGATNTTLGIGNTTAAGQVGGANAITGGLANITNGLQPFLYGTQSSYRKAGAGIPGLPGGTQGPF